MTLSHQNILAPLADSFITHTILPYDEICSFDEDDVESLKLVGAFFEDAIFKPFNPKY